MKSQGHLSPLPKLSRNHAGSFPSSSYRKKRRKKNAFNKMFPFFMMMRVTVRFFSVPNKRSDGKKGARHSSVRNNARTKMRQWSCNRRVFWALNSMWFASDLFMGQNQLYGEKMTKSFLCVSFDDRIMHNFWHGPGNQD